MHVRRHKSAELLQREDVGESYPTIHVILSEAKNLVPRAFSCLYATLTNTRGTRFFASLRMTWGSWFALIRHIFDFASALQKPAIMWLVAALLVASVPAFTLAAPSVQVPQPKVSTPFALAKGVSNLDPPGVAGNTMVYVVRQGGNYDVLGMDLTARKPYSISVAGWDERQPTTDGFRVVWRDGRNTDIKEDTNQLGNFDIYGASLIDRKPYLLTKAARLQNRPSIWGNIVVWGDFRNARAEDDQEAGDIYMHDLASGKETLISNARSAQTRPVTNGKMVVWVDYRNEPDPNGLNSDIYGFDLVTKQEFVISNAPDTQNDPAISGNTVVWADWRKGDGTADIYGYDLLTRKEFLISDAKGSQIRPSISADVVVWEDYRNEPDQEKGTNSDIYGYHIATKQAFPIYVGAGTQGFARVDGKTVVWEDGPKAEDSYDIMGTTISGISIVPPLPAPSTIVPGDNSYTFPETGNTTRGLFLDYWNNNGQLPQQGFPISGIMGEVNDLDGKMYAVQYFERAVFEHHPENQPPYNVLLSQLGTFQYKKKYPNGAPGQQPDNSPGSQLFPDTGKRVGGKFLEYWQTHGGLPQQGFPISDEFMEKSDLDGKTYRVQYFERAVFEYHPENQPPYDVLLSQLGTFQHKQKYADR
jgi:beta propeller repeat protein